MGIPLLSLDYFSKPEPTGSVSSTVARMMATAGAALSERVERQSQLTEAKLKAPAMTALAQGAYSKIATGDFSGFQDLLGANGLAAGNPLLAGLAKEAGDLGTTIANNYTQSRVLQSRFEQQKAMEAQRFQNRSVLQDDRQYAAELATVQKENAARQKRNEIATANAKAESEVSGRPVEPKLEELLPEPMPGKSGVISPTEEPQGLPEAPTGTNPVGLPQADDGHIAGPLPTGGAETGGQGAEPDISDPNTQRAKAVPKGEWVDNSAPDMGAAKASSDKDDPEPKVSLTRKEDSEEGDELQLGDVKIKIGLGKGKKEEMELQSVSVGPGGPTRTYRKGTEKDDTDKASRQKFVESVGTMNVDPQASTFVLKNWGKEKNPRIGFEETKDGKNVVSRRMYGIAEDGTRIAYNSGAAPGEAKPDEVSDDFYNAYKTMLATKDRVNEKFGITIKAPESKEGGGKKPSPLDRLSPAMRSLHADVFQKVKNGDISREEGQRLLKDAEAKQSKQGTKEDLLKQYGVADPDPKNEGGGVMERVRGGASPKTSNLVETLKKSIADIQKKLDSAKDRDYSSTATLTKGPVSGLDYYDKRKLVLALANAKAKLRELE